MNARADASPKGAVNSTTSLEDNTIYEVFARRKYEEPLAHVGNVTAPDDELAAVYARSIYDEWTWVEMVVVLRAALIPVIEPS
jgi:1,2-phenylacetyl-CoA epoxidase PaaB subunit